MTAARCIDCGAATVKDKAGTYVLHHNEDCPNRIPVEDPDAMSFARLRSHMLDAHGWPEERIDAARFVDWRDPVAGTRALTLVELQGKHRGEDIFGPKFKAYRAHIHAAGGGDE